MKKPRYTEERIAFALRQEEAGTPVADVIRKLGVSEATFYRWKKRFGGMGLPGCAGSSSWRRRTGSSSTSWRSRRWTSGR